MCTATCFVNTLSIKTVDKTLSYKGSKWHTQVPEVS